MRNLIKLGGVLMVAALLATILMGAGTENQGKKSKGAKQDSTAVSDSSYHWLIVEQYEASIIQQIQYYNQQIDAKQKEIEQTKTAINRLEGIANLLHAMHPKDSVRVKF